MWLVTRYVVTGFLLSIFFKAAASQTYGPVCFNNNAYEIVTANYSNTWNWTEARDLAAARTLNGCPGYLGKTVKLFRSLSIVRSISTTTMFIYKKKITLSNDHVGGRECHSEKPLQPGSSRCLDGRSQCEFNEHHLQLGHRPRGWHHVLHWGELLPVSSAVLRHLLQLESRSSPW